MKFHEVEFLSKEDLGNLNKTLLKTENSKEKISANL